MNKQIRTQEYINNKKITTDVKEIMEKLGVSRGMVSQYANGHNNASLDVAKKAYKLDKVVLYPFSEEGVSDE